MVTMNRDLPVIGKITEQLVHAPQLEISPNAPITDAGHGTSGSWSSDPAGYRGRSRGGFPFEPVLAVSGELASVVFDSMVEKERISIGFPLAGPVLLDLPQEVQAKGVPFIVPFDPSRRWGLRRRVNGLGRLIPEIEVGAVKPALPARSVKLIHLE